jgi:hypothetical protein
MEEGFAVERRLMLLPPTFTLSVGRREQPPRACSRLHLQL